MEERKMSSQKEKFERVIPGGFMGIDEDRINEMLPRFNVDTGIKSTGQILSEAKVNGRDSEIDYLSRALHEMKDGLEEAADQIKTAEEKTKLAVERIEALGQKNRDLNNSNGILKMKETSLRKIIREQSVPIASARQLLIEVINSSGVSINKRIQSALDILNGIIEKVPVEDTADTNGK